jgi:uncharacterized protein involved in exopolysaccharide biosynthesis
MTHTEQPEIPVRALPSMVEFLDMVFRNGRILGAVMTAITLGAVLFIVAAPRTYRTEALLMMRNDRAPAMISPVTSGQAMGGPVTENDLRTEVELLQSREMLENAARASGMAPAGAAGNEPLALAMIRVRKALKVTPVLKADMIRLEYTSTNRWEGDRFLRELLRIYQDKHIALRSSGKIKLFEEEADRLVKELREKERELARFQQEREVFLLGDQKSLALRKLVETEAALHDAELRQIDSGQRVQHLEALMENLPKRVTTQVRRVPNQYSVERLRTMLVELENRRVELLTKYRDDDRLVLQNAEQIATTKKALGDAVSSSAVEESTDLNPNRQSLEAELLRARVETSAAAARHGKLAGQRWKLRQELARLESATAEHEDLVRQVRELSDRYTLHARKSEEARIDSALDERRVTNVAVAQEPSIPARPEPRPYLAGAGLWLLGTGLTLAVVLALSRSRDLFYTPGSLERFTGIPVLGTVPMGGKQRERAA